MIQLKDIQFSYTTFEKGQGFRASLSDFFARKHITVQALQDINLHIKEGEFVGLLGPNGAGKTTLIKLITGILHPTSGQISCNGYYPYHKHKGFLKEIGVVLGQKSQLIWDLPAHETLLMLKEIYGIETREFEDRLRDMCQLLDVSSKLHVPVRKLSLGERIKFEIICSLIHSPKILFLDEPTIGLDITSQKAIRGFLKEINRDKKVTIVLTSHYMQDIEDLCQRVIILLDGRMTNDMTIEQLKELYQPIRKIRVDFRGQIPQVLANCGLVDLQSNSVVLEEETYLSLKEEIALRDILAINLQTDSFEELIYQLFTKSRDVT